MIDWDGADQSVRPNVGVVLIHRNFPEQGGRFQFKHKISWTDNDPIPAAELAAGLLIAEEKANKEIGRFRERDDFVAYNWSVVWLVRPAAYWEIVKVRNLTDHMREVESGFWRRILA